MLVESQHSPTQGAAFMASTTAHYEKLAHELLEEWARQKTSGGMLDGEFRSGGIPLDGSLAMSNAKGTGAPKRRYRRTKNGLLELPYYPAHGVETRPGKKVIPKSLIAQYNRINVIMEQIARGSADGSKYFRVLLYYYQYSSIEVAATKLSCGVSKARQLKKAAFDQVVLLLQTKKSQPDP